MSFATDVEIEVKRIFRETWATSKATVVPTPQAIALEKNEAKEIDSATVMYADLVGSTSMVDSKSRAFAAEVYRAYLYATAQIIRNQGGDITAYDGDRIMAVFMTSMPNTDAARCALKINHVVKKVINPAIASQYGIGTYTVEQVVGVDSSDLFVARTGVRGDNDLVWVGRAGNHAAKLTEIRNNIPAFITGTVFDRMQDSAKYAGAERNLMWTEYKWTAMGGTRIFGSNWSWGI